MNIFKRLFCKHKYQLMCGYTNLGWEKCGKCGKEIYTGENCKYTHFKFGKFVIKNKTN